MNPTRLLSSCLLLILPLLGGCFTPIPYDQQTAGYPGLRRPPGYAPNPNSRYGPPPGQRNPNQPGYPNERTNRWEVPFGQNPSANGRVEDPKPQPKPQPKRLEDKELVKPIDDPLNAREPVREEPKYPYGIPVKGKQNLILSPYAKDKGYIDVSGLPSGTQIECHWTKKIILVP